MADPVNEQFFVNQKNLLRIRASLAWDLGPSDRRLGRQEVYVCVVDNGCQSLPAVDPHTHPELRRAGNWGWAAADGEGVDFGQPNAPATNEGAHGTACAGVACADFDVTNGIVGVAPACRIFSLASAATVGELVQALNTARTGTPTLAGGSVASRQRRVILLSLPHSLNDPLITTAIQNAIAADIVVVVPTGNGDASTVAFPAAVPGVLAVGATNNPDPALPALPELRASSIAISPGTRNDADPWGSNYSATVPFVVAPGASIPATDMVLVAGNNGYVVGSNYVQNFSGTASAAAQVAGLAALLLSQNPILTERDVRRIIAQTCAKTGGSPAYVYSPIDGAHPDSIWNAEFGYGRIDARDAVQLAAASVPRLAVSATTLNFGTVLNGSGPTTLTFDVRHLTLQCTRVMNVQLSVPTSARYGIVAPAGFAINHAGFGGPAFAAHTVSVTYTPPAAGSGNGTDNATFTVTAVGEIDVLPITINLTAIRQDISDLVIRDTLADTGTTATGSSNASPDIWVRNAADGVLPPTYGDPPLHQSPDLNSTTNMIYLRVRNRGNVATAATTARVYLASGRLLITAPTAFDHNQAGNTAYNVSGAPASLNPGIYLIGTAAVSALGGGATALLSVPWPSTALRPPKDPTAPTQNWDPYLLVDFTTLDGPLVGVQIQNNNNLAGRQITYVDAVVPTVAFLDSTDLPLLSPFRVRTDTAAVDADNTIAFKVHIVDAGFFRVEDVTLIVTWHSRSGTDTTSTLTNVAGVWTASPAPTTPVTFGSPTSGGSPVTGFARDVLFAGTIVGRGDYEYVDLEINVSDGLGNAPASVDRRVRLKFTLPSDITLVMDYSGSMLTSDKWGSALSAAGMFEALYNELGRSQLVGAVQVLDRLGVLRFYTVGSAGPPVTTVDLDMVAISTAVPAIADPAYEQYTPIGTGILAARDITNLPASLAGTFRERRIVVMTDGIENRDPLLAVVRAATSGANFVPNAGTDPHGFIIDCCAFGSSSEISAGEIQATAMQFGGQYNATENYTTNPTSAFGLKVVYLNMLAGVLQATNLMGGTTGHDDATAFTLNSGIKEVVFVVTGAFDNTAAPFSSMPTAGTGTVVGAVTVHAEFSSVKVTRPTPGSYLPDFTSSGTVRAFAFIDLSLEATFDAERQNIGVGLPVRLWADLAENGVPVRGAKVVVTVNGPGISEAQVVLEATHGIDKAVWRKRLSSTTKTAEPRAARMELVALAIERMHATFPKFTNQVELAETSPGHYEGVWTQTANEGAYTFSYAATGKDGGGYAFERTLSLSRQLELVPDPGKTTVTWTQAHVGKLVSWVVTFVPTAVNGALLGPGLVDRMRVVVTNPVVHKTLLGPSHEIFLRTNPKLVSRSLPGSLPIVDNVDGSYSVSLELAPGQSPPVLTLTYGSVHIVLGGGPTVCRRVRITLRKLRVLDDHETKRNEPAELTFDTIVAPNGDLNRAMRRRIPEKGFLNLRDGQWMTHPVVIFDAFIELGATLEVLAGGTEFDFYRGRLHEDPLAKYHRTLNGEMESWVGEYTPTDGGKKDPESLEDWRLWYDVEIV